MAAALLACLHPISHSKLQFTLRIHRSVWGGGYPFPVIEWATRKILL
jgi:hypothetical protein